jgi:hypothetical protein
MIFAIILSFVGPIVLFVLSMFMGSAMAFHYSGDTSGEFNLSAALLSLAIFAAFIVLVTVIVCTYVAAFGRLADYLNEDALVGEANFLIKLVISAGGLFVGGLSIAAFPIAGCIGLCMLVAGAGYWIVVDIRMIIFIYQLRAAVGTRI